MFCEALLYYKEKLNGFIGFDECKRYREWDDVTVEFLINNASGIASFIERKEAEDILKTHSEILGNMVEGVNLSDENGIIKLTNKAFDDMFGYEQGELIGKAVNILNAYSHEENTRFVNDVIESLTTEGFWSGEASNRKKDGTLFSTFCTLTPIDLSGKRHFIDVQKDITERKQLEEERMKTEKLESIGILAGGIAHDFNNILAAILGNISLAKISVDNKNEVVELLTESERVTLNAKDLTQQLLTFSRGGVPVKETTELTELIRDTARFSLRGSNVQYSTSITPDLWAADVDKGQISQAIGNLVINAQQAMPEGGTVNIKAENVTVTKGVNLPLQDGYYIKITLKDQGTGIPQEHLVKVFDPYFTTKQKGSGLGLTTTYSIIKRHNGHITVESEIGVGTTFHIYLPASSKQVEKKVSIKEEPAIFKGKILIMDDEPEIRDIVSKILTRSGNEVETASDGTEALELYKKAMDSGKPFDVVIMDLTIPGGMGGKKAIKKLLEIDPDAKAIVSSGYSTDPVLSNFEKYGFRGKISKPYKFRKLIEALNNVMTQDSKY